MIQWSNQISENVSSSNMFDYTEILFHIPPLLVNAIISHGLLISGSSLEISPKNTEAWLQKKKRFEQESAGFLSECVV